MKAKKLSINFLKYKGNNLRSSGIGVQSQSKREKAQRETNWFLENTNLLELQFSPFNSSFIRLLSET